MSKEIIHAQNLIITDDKSGGNVYIKAGRNETLVIDGASLVTTVIEETIINTTVINNSTINNTTIVNPTIEGDVTLSFTDDVVTETWNPTQTTVGPGSVDATAGFGTRLSFQGTTLVTAVPGQTTGAVSGGVDVWTETSNVWAHQQLICPEPPDCDTVFGSSALYGDLLAIGVTDPTGGAQEGNVVVYTRSGSTWTFDSYLSDLHKGYYGLFYNGTYLFCVDYVSGVDYRLGVYTRTGVASWTGPVASANFTEPNPSCCDAWGGLAAVGLLADNVLIINSAGTLLSTITVTSPDCVKLTDSYILIGAGTSVTVYDLAYSLLKTITLPVNAVLMTGTGIDDTVVVLGSDNKLYKLLCDEDYGWFLQDDTIVIVGTVDSIKTNSEGLIALGIPAFNSGQGKVTVCAESVTTGTSTETISEITVDVNGIDMMSLVPIDFYPSAVRILGEQNSTSTTDGILQVTGGIGCAKRLTCLNASVTSTTDSSSVSTGACLISGGLGVSKTITALNASITATTDSSSVSTGACLISGGLGVSKNLTSLTAKVTSTTDASSTTTGCLQLSGGLGVAKTIYAAQPYGRTVASAAGLYTLGVTNQLTSYWSNSPTLAGGMTMASQGIFTVPVTGVYLCTCDLFLNVTPAIITSLSCYFYDGANRYGQYYVNGQGQTATISAFIPLTASSVLSVYLGTTGSGTFVMYTSFGSAFSIYKVV